MAVFSLLAAPARAQQSQPPPLVLEEQGFSTSSSSWEGLSEFVRLASDHLGPGRVQVRATLDFRSLEAHDAILVIHPRSALNADSLTRFLTAGGRLAVLDDFGESTEFLERFGIRRVRPPLDPVEKLHDDPALAIAVPSSQVVAGVERGRHPMTEGVTRVMTNHPVTFLHPNLTPVLEIEDRGGPPGALALTGIIAEQGRLVAVGDSSLFINLMLRYPGNRAFARGLLDYLLARSAGEQPGKLWIVSGGFKQTGRFGSGNFGDEVKERAEQAREALRGLETSGLPPLLALSLAACLAFYVMRREAPELLRSPRVGRPSFARPALVAAQTGLLARAEILAAPTTPAVLVVLELLAALEESLRTRLGVEPSLSRQTLESELGRAGLTAAESQELGALLGTLRDKTRGIEAGKQPRTSEAEMKRIHEEVMAALRRIERASRAPSP